LKDVRGLGEKSSALTFAKQTFRATLLPKGVLRLERRVKHVDKLERIAVRCRLLLRSLRVSWKLADSCLLVCFCLVRVCSSAFA
jgi:hypothetical protein